MGVEEPMALSLIQSLTLVGAVPEDQLNLRVSDSLEAGTKLWNWPAIRPFLTRV